MNSEAQSIAAAIPDPRFRRDCVISQQDFEVLLRAAESEREIGYRNFFAGIAVSSSLGTLSTIASHFDELVSGGIAPMASLLLILLAAVTLASGALATFFYRRLRNDAGHRAYRALDCDLRSQLEQPAELDDPRHWP